jgi:subtilisin family serine protease
MEPIKPLVGEETAGTVTSVANLHTIVRDALAMDAIGVQEMLFVTTPTSIRLPASFRVAILLPIIPRIRAKTLNRTNSLSTYIDIMVVVMVVSKVTWLLSQRKSWPGLAQEDRILNDSACILLFDSKLYPLPSLFLFHSFSPIFFLFFSSSTVYSDPLYQANAWIWDMIDVLPVWQQGIRGKGIRVRINDDGVDITHPEFQGRYDAAASCDNILPTDSAHGTAVASIVLAGNNNNECSVGVAPEATLNVCNVFDGRSEAFLADKIDMYDISQNSFGVPACGERRDLEEGQRELQTCPFAYNDPNDGWPCEGNGCDFGSSTPSLQCEQAIVFHCQTYYEKDVAACLQFLELFIPGGTCDYNELTPIARDSFATGILQGRGGKGMIYVFAAGNSFQYGEDVNFKGFTNTRFTITVGAVGKDGLHASYSTPGASTLVVGPGGDAETRSNHITADPGGGCHDAGVGTSFASPVVSGVIALVLQVNPELTWRDVQGILVQTSKYIGNDPNDSTRHTNAAGFTHSNLYGFGIVNANAAVEAASTWQLYTPEKQVIGVSGILDEPLVDDPAQAFTSSISVVPDTFDFIAESIEVYIALQHLSRGDLEITLQSPSGTVSILHPGQRPESTVLNVSDRWKLLTVRNWGETAKGVWQMTIRDIRSAATSGCVDEPWSLIAGTELTCGYVETTIGYCSDGNIFPENVDPGEATFLAGATSETPSNGLTLAEACCACGGGNPASTIENKIQQWRIVVYGREILSPPTEAPTAAPTTTTTITPTLMPSVAPVDIPTVLPTETPTSVAPVDIPTVLPSETPTSVAPVDIPTLFPTETPTSVAPVEIPTMLPSETPTSVAPVDIPTLFPTDTPTSVAPVDMPTVFPTETPTSAPQTTQAPAQTGFCPDDQCCISSSVAQCPALFAATNPQETCDCYNFCDGVFIGCCQFGALCIVNCAQNLVAGCEAAGPTTIPTAAPTPVLAPDQPTTSAPKQCLVTVRNDQCYDLMATQEPKANCDCYNFCHGEVSCCAFDEPCPTDCTGDFVAGCQGPKPTTCAVTVGIAQCGPLVAQQTPIPDCDCYHYCNGEFAGCTEYGEFGNFKCDGNAVTGCEIEEEPIGECTVVGKTAECGPLIETQQPVQDCDCYNYCGGSYAGCCPYGQFCPIDCDTGSFVAGCELGGGQTSPPPTPAPVGNTRQPFFFWPDGFDAGANNKPGPKPAPTTPRPTAPSTPRPSKAPRQPFFFWPDGYMAPPRQEYAVAVNPGGEEEGM